jgi:hypothetical protein
VAKDLTVRALELVSAQPSQADLTNGLLLLKQAQQACDEDGDAWYYRSLFERQLGHAKLAEYALGKARERGSHALKDTDDPFHLATPSSRGASLIPKADTGIRDAPKATLDARKPEVADKWALVIGISNFSNRNLHLNYTRIDAQAFATLLRDPVYGRFRPDHVKVLEDEQATTVNIKSGLSWLSRMAGPDDLAVVYIATHGTARDKDVAEANYIVTFDTDVESADGLYSTAIPMVEISNAVRTRLRALKAVVFLDTCHSAGAAANTVTVPSSISPRMLDHIREGTGRVIIAASQEEEEAFEDRRYGHGLFTYYLLQGLKQKQGDLPIPGVYEYLRSHMAQDTAARGWKQHPVYSSSEQESVIVLGIPPRPAP